MNRNPSGSFTSTSRVSWVQRLKQSNSGVLTGIVLIRARFNMLVNGGRLLASLLLFGALSAPLAAATIVVDTVDDLVAADGQCSLREAIINANNANQSGSTECVAGEAHANRIRFAPELAGQTIVLNGTPLPIITRTLAIEGPGENDWSALTIDGNDEVRILQFDAGFSGSFVAFLRNLTLTNGRTDELNQPGGGLWSRNVDLTLRDVDIRDNRTTGSSSMAGGVWISGGQVELIDSRVSDNTAQNAGGGVMITDGELTLVRTTVAGNQATSAGGIRLVNSTLSADASIISNNSSSGAAGGLSVDTSVANFLNSTISGNMAATAGGAMYVDRGDVSLVQSTVAFNTGSTNYGIFLFAMEDEPASLYLTNSLVLQAEPAQVACSAPSEYATIIGGNSLATHAGCTGVATPLASINPGPLADNGGPTLTHALLAGSVAIDAGGDCVADRGLDEDQRGEPRPGGESSACDLGAYEAQEVQLQADLALTKTVLPTEAATGETVVFNLSVNNLGPDEASGVVVVDELPAGFSYLDSTADQGSYDSATGLWTVGSLANGASAGLSIEAVVTTSGPYLNTASVSAETFDPDLSNNEAEAEVSIVEPQADLAVSKQVNPAQAEVGASVTFTVIAANLGPDNATGVLVIDQLPDGYEYVESSATQGSFDAGTGHWQIGSLDNGGSATLTLQATVTAMDDYLNSASISGDQVDPNAGNNTASAGITLPPELADPIVVTTSLDVVSEDGLCSLREAIINANNANQSGSADCGAGAASLNLIHFHSDLIGSTIELEGTLLPSLTRPLIIEGPASGNPDGLILDGQSLGRVLVATTGADLVLRDLTITGGLATGSSSGGGVSVNNADLELARVVIRENATGTGAGGGLSVSSGALTITDSSIVGNQATGLGGGMQLTNVVGEIRGSTIAGNEAGNSGGGVSLQNSSLTLINSSVSDNSTAGQGGAMQVISSTVSIIHSSLVFNLSDQLIQGISLLGSETHPASLELLNSLVVQSAPDEVACHAGPHSALNGTGSLSSDTACPGDVATLEALAIGPLEDHGGLTPTHALAPGSVAIGAGGLCGFDFGLLTDQRGLPRPGGHSSHCDVGAYESQFAGDAVFRDRFQSAASPDMHSSVNRRVDSGKGSGQ